mgnify:CR=1 FL=1
MPIYKRMIQGVLVLGWLVWSIPAMGAGEHSPHEGQKMGHGSDKHRSSWNAGSGEGAVWRYVAGRSLKL